MVPTNGPYVYAGVENNGQPNRFESRFISPKTPIAAVKHENTKVATMPRLRARPALCSPMSFLLLISTKIAIETIGIMVVEAFGDQNNIDAGIHYLTEQGLQVEVIGYVASND